MRVINLCPHPVDVVLAGGEHRTYPPNGPPARVSRQTVTVATIESIEQDYEDVVYLAVTIDEDPGADLGMLRQPGHRFFYTLNDVEPVPAGEGA